MKSSGAGECRVIAEIILEVSLNLIHRLGAETLGGWKTVK